MEFKGIGKEWDLAELNISDMKQITIFCSNPKQVIAHIYLPDYEITPELQANAKLISKAPEMLEQLKECLEFLQKVQSPATQALFLSQSIKNLIKEATTI